MSERNPDDTDTGVPFETLYQSAKHTLEDGYNSEKLTDAEMAALTDDYTVKMSVVDFGAIIVALNDACQIPTEQRDGPHTGHISTIVMELAVEQAAAFTATNEGDDGGIGTIRLPGGLWAYTVVSLNITEALNDPMPASEMVSVCRSDLLEQLPEEIKAVADHDTPDVSEFNPLAVEASNLPEMLSGLVGSGDSPSTDELLDEMDTEEFTDIEFDTDTDTDADTDDAN